MKKRLAKKIAKTVDIDSETRTYSCVCYYIGDDGIFRPVYNQNQIKKAMKRKEWVKYYTYVPFYEFTK